MTRARLFAAWGPVGLVGLGGCGEEPAPEAPVARPVGVLGLGDAGGGRWIEYPGEISPAQNADIGFEVSGKLVEFPVMESERVQRGQVLARLDPRDSVFYRHES